ncbi:MAG: GuaB3 family IMP dehydrogenase-related protein [Candidatus Omnitrophica bacterium]|nr:GuaB3 family IMP dehydrogenase-related protein [Candidatus Omnitrophota bacterium]MCM8817746.1 GuaB3 family IMP dehydrogenase-related protein [Candidatus Omnitrophota bacterium]
MGMWIGRGRKARVCYGFDDISLVPGNVTINPLDVDISVEIAGKKLQVPILAAAMDGVVDPKFAVAFGRLGGLAVLNLMGIYTRYEDPYSVIEEIIQCPQDKSTALIQKVYQEPIKEDLITRRIQEIKKEGVLCAVSSIPQYAEKFGAISQEAGADIFVVQSTVTTVRHISSTYEPLDLYKFCKSMKVPVITGNCVTYQVALELMETGIAGLLVGIGPGAACTTREVLGIGVPQVAATCDCAAARDFFYKRTGKYIPIITDGGMITSGDICKAFACGADAVMVGSAFVRSKEAPAKGYHWGMATSDENLPRGTRIRLGTTGSIKQILFGPSNTDDGSQNLVGALRLSMASLGARNIKEMQLVEIAIAPSIKTEGKIYQVAKKQAMLGK